MHNSAKTCVQECFIFITILHQNPWTILRLVCTDWNAFSCQILKWHENMSWTKKNSFFWGGGQFFLHSTHKYIHANVVEDSSDSLVFESCDDSGDVLDDSTSSFFGVTGLVTCGASDTLGAKWPSNLGRWWEKKKSFTNYMRKFKIQHYKLLY